MRLVEKSVSIPLAPGHRDLLTHIERSLTFRLSDDEVPIRFVITKIDDTAYHCEIGCLVEGGNLSFAASPILEFRKRPIQRRDTFNAVFVVPTGAGAELGGHAGDAAPAARLLAACCDLLVTHPNVVNASDINELPDNALYVEGSVISRLLMGTAGLSAVRSNRVLVVFDARPDEMIENLTVNTIEAARAAFGMDGAGIYKLDPPLELVAEYAQSGRAVGRSGQISDLVALLKDKREDYDAVAISSLITVPDGYHEQYFASDGAMVNPWGGIEAMLTHAVSQLLDVPSAHAPMMESREILFDDPGRVDPRMAAEAISSSFLYCVLKGLTRSPVVVSDPSLLQSSDITSAENISCLVIPDGCLGLPVMAALEQGITVVAVREGAGTLSNDLGALPWQRNQLLYAENYWEAAGILSSLRAGVDPQTVRRPLQRQEVEAWSSTENIAPTGRRQEG